MPNLITADVLREAAKGITEADAVEPYTPAEYTTTPWMDTPIGHMGLRSAILMSYPEGTRAYEVHVLTGVMVARAVAEVARVVAANAVYVEGEDTSAEDALDALENLYGEMSQVRTAPDSRGLLVIFTATKDA